MAMEYRIIELNCDTYETICFIRPLMKRNLLFAIRCVCHCSRCSVDGINHVVDINTFDCNFDDYFASLTIILKFIVLHVLYRKSTKAALSSHETFVNLS